MAVTLNFVAKELGNGIHQSSLGAHCLLVIQKITHSVSTTVVSPHSNRRNEGVQVHLFECFRNVNSILRDPGIQSARSKQESVDYSILPVVVDSWIWAVEGAPSSDVRLRESEIVNVMVPVTRVIELAEHVASKDDLDLCGCLENIPRVWVPQVLGNNLILVEQVSVSQNDKSQFCSVWLICESLEVVM